MEYDVLARLKTSHPALRLLCADYLPLIASFFNFMFLQENRRSIPHGELVSRLDDFLYGLRQREGEETYPRSGREYLEEWSNPPTSFLRKYYTDLSDEPELDLTPATEKALEWLRDLTAERNFIGTESRLLTLVKLLRELVQRTEDDPEKRIAALEQERMAIEAEIAKAKAGIIEKLDPTQVKERFFEVEETGKKLLADFRQIECNFRALDRDTRERIASSEKAKGDLLDEIFVDHDVIWDSDQGRSFRAFWEFLMSPSRQDELEELIKETYAREEVRELSPQPLLSNIKIYLLEAGEKVYKTNNLLADQLRKFLDDRAYLENRRIMDLIHSIEKVAIEIKDSAPESRDFEDVAGLAPELDLVMCRGLYIPPVISRLQDIPTEEGEMEIPLSALYSQVYVDERRLLANIRKALQSCDQVSLKELVKEFPLENGLAEVVAYLGIAVHFPKAVIDDIEVEKILYRVGDMTRMLRMPRVIFVR